MKNDPISNNAMARVYRTAVVVSALILSSSLALAADPPVGRGNVSATVNPTTGYYVVSNKTVRLPNGVSVAPTSGGLPVVSKYAGGLQQTIPSGITIDAIKKTAPLSATVRATTQTVKGAATRCLTSAKCNVALLLAGAGLDQLFDGLDWVMGEGGKIQKHDYIPDPTGTAAAFRVRDSDAYAIFTNISCPAYLNPFSCPIGCQVQYDDVRYPYLSGAITAVNCPNGNTLRGSLGNTNYTMGTFVKSSVSGSVDVPVSEVSSGVESNYVPEPSDWPALAPHLDLDDVEITWAPTLQGEPITKTEYDADGNPHKITETNIWYDFDIRDNPSPNPKLDLKTREETKTYEDGTLTGTTTTESTASAGSEETPLPSPESPIDCDLFPTACAWFEWTKEEPVEPDDDLSGLLQEVPIDSKTFTMTGGAAVCPAPLVLDLSVFGSREVSYQPLCDLASTMKFLYLALMSFAAAVLLNRSINRV